MKPDCSAASRPRRPNRQPEFRMRAQRRVEKISTAISLVGLALGFSVLGLLIVAKEHDGGASITGGILGILLGAAFLIAACLHWNRCDQIQGGFQSGQPLFQSVNSAGTEVTGRALNRYNAWAPIRKRAKAAGFLTPGGCYTWRDTGTRVFRGH